MNTTDKEETIKKPKTFFQRIGPGIISGAADDDPSGIATYSQAGAQYGTGFLWLAFWTWPLMAMVQEMCSRIALVTGKGLASNIKKSYSKKILYVCTALLFMANTLNIGADLGAIAEGIQLIVPKAHFVMLIVGMGIIGLLMQIYIPYKKFVKIIKWLVVSLFAYIVTGFFIHMDWAKLAIDGIIPHFKFSSDSILMITGILGTTISPYLFFWQTSQEVEEEIADGKTTIHARRGTNHKEIKNMRIDTWTGIFLSNLVMFFIIAVCANTLFANGITNIETASDAARALEPFAGPWAKYLFAIGIIGTGMLAIPVLAGSTSYALAESFNWKEGLYRTFKEAHAFYGVIIVSVLVGIGINFLGIDPIKALIYSAIANGIIAPVMIFFIVHMSGSEKIMGRHKNSRSTNLIGWLITAFMGITALATIISLF